MNFNPTKPLSPSQQKVCDLMLQGLSNKEIARVVGLSPATIRTHASQVLRRHQVTTRERLLARALACALAA